MVYQEIAVATAERLIVREGTPPATADGSAMGCVMLVSTGKNPETQWFEFKTSYLPPAPIVRVEWEADTMNVVIPADTATWLIKKNYARSMKASEARAYNNGLEKAERSERSEKSEKSEMPSDRQKETET
jgi:hypothetical protein